MFIVNCMYACKYSIVLLLLLMYKGGRKKCIKRNSAGAAKADSCDEKCIKNACVTFYIYIKIGAPIYILRC